MAIGLENLYDKQTFTPPPGSTLGATGGGSAQSSIPGDINWNF